MGIGGIGGGSGLMSLWAPKSTNPPGLQAPTSGPAAASSGDPVKDEFMKWAQMTPAQRMRANILQSMGMSEDQLKAMDPDKRKAIEDQIAQMIKQKLTGDPQTKDQTGLLADIKV